MFSNARIQNACIRLDTLKGEGKQQPKQTNQPQTKKKTHPKNPKKRKKKKKEVGAGRILEKLQVGIQPAEIQIETNIPENAFPLQPAKLQLKKEGFQNLETLNSSWFSSP